MPSAQQIIPSYSVPHVATYINDNSQVSPITSTVAADPSVQFLCVFASPKGEDGTVKLITDTDTYLKTYGTPNMAKYGQAGYIPYLALSTGSAKCYCVRVAPGDAKYANLVIMANVTPKLVSFNLVEITATSDIAANTYSVAVGEGDAAVTYSITLPRTVTTSQVITLYISTDASVASFAKIPGTGSETERVDLTVLEAGQTAAGTIDTQNATIGAATPTEISYGTEVVYTAESIDEMSSSTYESLQTAVDGMQAEGKYPVIAFASKGRGVYGNDFAIRITNDTYGDNAINGNGYKNYIVELISNENGVSVLESFRGTLLQDSVVDNKTLFIEDVVNDPENGSHNIIVYVPTDSVDAVYNTYVTNTETVSGSLAIEPIEPIDQTEFDYFFGRIKGSSASTDLVDYYAIGSSIEVDGVSVAAVNFGTTTGVNFIGGTDGTSDAASYENEYKKAFFAGTDSEYLKTFNDILAEGEGRRYIGLNSKRRTPVQVILDANYPISVKKSLVTLVAKRGDCKLYLDCGICDTITALNSVNSSISETSGIYNFGEYFFLERFGQCYRTKDIFTGKVIRVTPTYGLASMIPTHYITNGNQVPLVGERYALLPNVIPGSVTPNIDADDLDTKESLYLKHINTIDTLSDSQYIIATQVTSQSKVTDLSEGNNVAVLLEMKRRLENLVLSKIYEFSDAEDRTKFTNDADEIFNSYRNSKVRNFTVRFDMNEFEAERNILHCYLEVIFRQISTRGIIEIDINKRTS